MSEVNCGIYDVRPFRGLRRAASLELIIELLSPRRGVVLCAISYHSNMETVLVMPVVLNLPVLSAVQVYS